MTDPRYTTIVEKLRTIHAMRRRERDHVEIGLWLAEADVVLVEDRIEQLLGEEEVDAQKLAIAHDDLRSCQENVERLKEELEEMQERYLVTSRLLGRMPRGAV